SRRRFAATDSASSPTWSPRLKESYGDRETPPERVVTTRRIPTFTPSRSQHHSARPIEYNAGRTAERGLTTHERWHVDVVVARLVGHRNRPARQPTLRTLTGLLGLARVGHRITARRSGLRQTTLLLFSRLVRGPSGRDRRGSGVLLRGILRTAGLFSGL